MKDLEDLIYQAQNAQDKGRRLDYGLIALEKLATYVAALERRIKKLEAECQECHLKETP